MKDRDAENKECFLLIVASISQVQCDIGCNQYNYSFPSSMKQLINMKVLSSVVSSESYFI